MDMLRWTDRLYSLQYFAKASDAKTCFWCLLTFRDSFEDELRAFEGGAQGLLPCVWAYEVPAFPQVRDVFGIYQYILVPPILDGNSIF